MLFSFSPAHLCWIQTARVTGETPALMPSFDPQAPPNSPGLSAVQACAVLSLPHPGVFQAGWGKGGTWDGARDGRAPGFQLLLPPSREGYPYLLVRALVSQRHRRGRFPGSQGQDLLVSSLAEENA